VSYVSTWAHSHEELENKFGSLTKGAWIYKSTQIFYQVLLTGP
jgi:hypothetical protein